MEKSGGFLNLILNLPRGLYNKLLTKYKGFDEETIELVVLYAEAAETVRKQVEDLNGVFEDLGYGFGIITVQFRDIERVGEIPEIQYIELPKNLYYNSQATNKASCVGDSGEVYGLQGEGILIGFIDSGIDYTLEEFKDDTGNTRIEYIYDLALKSVYNKEQINEALKAQDPYSIVPHFDGTGHGTAVAGIACAGGKIPLAYYGVAPKSSIAMVKITKEGTGGFTKSTQIMRGIKFLVDRAKEIKKPLVINLSFSTNDGAHNGNSLFEKYISIICSLERLSFVVAAGNEGDKAHHVSTFLKNQEKIDFSVGQFESAVVFQLYKDFIADISIEIIAPNGSRSGIIPFNKAFIEGNIRDAYYFVYSSGPVPFNIGGETIISIIAQNDYLVDGIWTLNLYRDRTDVTKIDIWLPISEIISNKTRFLNPTVYNTVGIPGTVKEVITVGSYDSLLGNISSFSGRGRQSSLFIKPDLVAPGEKVDVITPDGGLDSLTGTSMAAPSVAGAAAILMEWGFTKGRDPYMYGDRLKYFLLKGARRNRPTEEYPNPVWGYGTLCVRNAIETWLDEAPLRNFNKENFIYREIPGGEQMNNEPPSVQVPINNESLISNAPSGQTDKSQIDAQTEEINESLNKFLFESHNDLFNLEQCKEKIGTSEIDSFVVEYAGDILSEFIKLDYACVFIINEIYGVVVVKKGEENRLFAESKTITNIERNKAFTLSSISPLESSNIYKFHNNPFLNLRGTGVIVGILDTGIDYLNKEFMTEDGNTRIVGILDQTIQSNDPKVSTNFGIFYSSSDINRAIKAQREGKDPYKIVPHKDNVGHGTEVAGIIGARGINGVTGAAPDCRFLVVKLKEADKNLLTENAIYYTDKIIYSTSEIMVGINYLVEYHNGVNRPMVICLPLESNSGGHAGQSVIERFIDRYVTTRGLIAVSGVGNEGDSATHTAGRFTRSGEVETVELQIDDNQKGISIFIWANSPDKISVGIVSPSGEVVERVPAKLQQRKEITFIYEKTKAEITYYFPENATGNEFIRIVMYNVKGGLWQIRLTADYIVDGRYDIWIYQRYLLEPNTRFLSPVADITLCTPSTANNIITTAYYNQDKDTLMPESGRGYTRDGRIKPDLAIGGYNVLTTTVGGGTKLVTGSSIATGILAGTVALILEWGIIKGNDPYLYTNKVRTYLIRGTKKRLGDIYPNRELGYGILDLNGVFENIRSIELMREYDDQGMRATNLHFHIPKNIMKYIIDDN